jgi:hypothetical protein
VILRELVLFDFLTVVVREVVDHFCTLIAFGLDNELDETHEVLFVFGLELDYHTCVNQCKFHVLFRSAHYLSHLSLFCFTLVVNSFQILLLYCLLCQKLLQ